MVADAQTMARTAGFEIANVEPDGLPPSSYAWSDQWWSSAGVRPREYSPCMDHRSSWMLTSAEGEASRVIESHARIVPWWCGGH